MTITLTRSPEVNGSLIKFKVWLNNEQVTKIALGEEKGISLPEENSEMQIKQFSGKSNTLTVNDGDHVEICNGTGLRWMILLTVIYVLTITIFDGPIILISLFIAIICFFVLLRKADTFNLTKINESAP